MEIGPGDSLFSALIAYAFGSSKTLLVDSGNYVNADMGAYRAMADFLKGKNMRVPDFKGSGSLEELLDACGSSYYTEGLKSLQVIPGQSVNYIWSQAVLEHIRLAEFKDFMLEQRRIISNDGVCSHRIDLKDHLGGALNHLRFSKRVWETDFMSSSGFYTNRLRYNELLDIFREVGFTAHVVQVDKWESMPTARTKLAEPFRHLDNEHLNISGFDVILRPANGLGINLSNRSK